MNTQADTAAAAAPAGNARRNWIALLTIMRREVVRILRIWGQTLVPPAITMTLYFLIFGGLIGARIGDMGGYSYMEFIVPGLIMMSVITNSYSNVVSSFYSSKFQRNIEELLVSPVSPHTIRTQLKSVFLKTGTNRQSELVALLLASPAYFIVG